MDDRDIEQLLRRYTPAGPPPNLRARILARPPMIRIWPWAAAASVLLAGTVALHALAGRTVARADIGADQDHARLAVEELTEILGGDDAARLIAEAAIERTRMQIQSAPATVPMTYEEAQ